MRPVQGVFRHIIHEHIQPIIEKKAPPTTSTPWMTPGVSATPMEPPWQRNKVDDFDVLFQASSSSSKASKCVLIVMTIIIAAAMSIRII